MGKKTAQQIMVKICCVIASLCLWLYISNWENPVGTYKVKNVTVELSNIEGLKNSKLALIPGQKFQIDLNIRGTVTDSFNVKPGDFKAVVDMSTYALKKGDNKVPVHLVNYPNNINIINGENMMIDIKLDELEEKNVPVKIRVEGQPKSGTYISGAVAKPSDVLVSGPASYVDRVSYVEALQQASGFTKDVEVNVPLKAYDVEGKVINEVKIQPEEAQVFIPIKTSKSVKINIKTIGSVSNNNLVLKAIVPSQGNIEISADQASLEKLQGIDTENIDLDSIGFSKTIDVKLIIPNQFKVLKGTDTIQVKIDVEKIVKKTIIKDIDFKNIGVGLSVSSDVKKVTVVVSGNESIINDLKDYDIVCTADLQGMSQGALNAVITVSIVQGVSIVSVNPRSINVNLK